MNESGLAKQLLPPEYAEEVLAIPAQEATCTQEIESSFRQRREMQMGLKNENLAQSVKKTALVEELLKNPDMKQIKERYDNIKSCQAGAVN